MGNLNLIKDNYLILKNSAQKQFFHEINCLAPFGSGNNEPKFLIENIKVLSSDSFGQKHIRSILIGKDGSTFNGLAFNALNTPLEGYLNKKNKKLFNVAGKMRLNEWRGKKDVEFLRYPH